MDRVQQHQVHDRERRNGEMTTMGNKPTALPEIDEDGFLKKEDTWTREVAQLLAQIMMPGELTDDHWRVINYLRHYYLEFGSVPPVRKLSRDIVISLRELKELFPGGVTKDACIMAGIPKRAVTGLQYSGYTLPRVRTSHV